MYDHKLKTKWDNEAVLDYAEKKGIEIGRQEGRLEGLEEGMEKGERKKAIAVAIDLKKEGLSIEFIAKTTKLSIEEIQAL